MTIRQMAQLSGVDYQFVYQAMIYTGQLKRGKKNMDYDPEALTMACAEYIEYRLNKSMQKIEQLDNALDKISSFAKKSSQEQG